ncbi:hypothetical protein [Streptomyces albogriseolus]|uniref:hypothetical protein n=1 Tax=Streptomyces albogriseolus TaxID=1887 RepID=UPI003806D849
MSIANLGAIINSSPRPRLLVSGFEQDSALVEEILATCPTSKVVQSFTDVRQAEWDILVTTRPLRKVGQNGRNIQRLEPNISVIYVASSSNQFPYATIENRADWDGEMRHGGRVISQEIRRVRGLPERISTLVHEKLEPVLTRRESHPKFSRVAWESENIPELEPFICTPDGDVLAGRYKRSDAAEAWLLPHDTPDLVDWVKAAIAEWHSLAPERFPGIPDWSRQSKWMTPTEKRISAEISKVRERRRALLAELADREGELEKKLADVVEAADASERALLTTQSDALKHAVMTALNSLGFTVIDADKDAAADDHLEDLHITDPDRPGWIALGEVKGYTRGAKTEGIAQFLRFNMRFADREKRSPDANWYIVNQFLNRDPSTRQKALHGKDGDIAAFGAAKGLVIDTVELFKLLVRFQDGKITAEEARRLLVESTGRFVL